jgi:predicted transposase/invertase (TIGR01784 family)
MGHTVQEPNTIYYAHDHFFRTVMKDVRVAREFFTVHLPVDLQKLINFNNLVLQPRSYINDVRKETIVDVLYKTTLGEHEAYLYLLIEHQSSPDELMPLRMIQYTCNILDEHIKKQKGKKSLPLVYPIVIYHGKQTYPYSTNINDLVNAPKELVEQYFLKPFQLIDLGRIADEEIKRNAWVGVMEFALKYIYARDILPYLRSMAEIMRQVDLAGGRNYITIVLEYLLEKGETYNKNAFFELINKEILPEMESDVMTIAEQLRMEGRLEGKKEGIMEGKIEGKIEGKLEVARRLLAQDIDMELIARVTELSFNQIKELS